MAVMSETYYHVVIDLFHIEYALRFGLNNRPYTSQANYVNDCLNKKICQKFRH